MAEEQVDIIDDLEVCGDREGEYRCNRLPRHLGNHEQRSTFDNFLWCSWPQRGK